MKTLELKLKKYVLIVDENDFDYYELFKDGIYLKLANGDRDYIEGNFELLCKCSELTEEIASELVEEHYMNGIRSYEIYNDYRYNDSRLLDNAKESFISAVESKEFFWLKHNVRNFSLYDPRSKTGCHDLEEEDIITKQWQEAEEKTFKNPLIFVKK